MEHVSNTTKHVIDAASAITVVGTLTAWLPPIAAGLTIIWTLLRIYEWFEKRMKKIPTEDKEQSE